MVDTSRLKTLLQLDERGEYLVEMLSRKRSRLLVRQLEMDQDGRTSTRSLS